MGYYNVMKLVMRCSDDCDGEEHYILISLAMYMLRRCVKWMWIYVLLGKNSVSLSTGLFGDWQEAPFCPKSMVWTTVVPSSDNKTRLPAMLL